jgi:hypothetical protein
VDTDRLWHQSPAAVARFGQGAEAYDRYRPGYPDELFSHLADVCGLAGDSVIPVRVTRGLSPLDVCK